MTSENPVFVVGVFRSGTSLFYTLLNQHPQVALMYECDVWDFPGIFSRRRFDGTWLERQEFYNQALSRHRLILGGSLRGLEKIKTPDDLYRCHCETKGAKVWGEKSPVYAARLARLARHYPKGSFILIWRDPVEIYRSMKAAGKKSSFFRKPTMFQRLIHHQETMIKDALQMERAGRRVYHVNYDKLVDNTDEVCRGVCQFLEIEFDPRMAQLEQADYSAIYQAPQHDFLRRGVIERRPEKEDLVKPETAAKLARFRKRWERLAGRPLSLKPMPAKTEEPPVGELLADRTKGMLVHSGDILTRVLFEFLPLPWLRTYRLFKGWVFSREDSSGRPTLASELRQHGVTVIVSFLLVALVATLDFVTGSEISCRPLYLIPCAALALVAGPKWATIVAMACAGSVTILSEGQSHHFHSWFTGAVIWNLAMRFIFFEVFVLLLDRIRRDLSAQAESRKSALIE